MALFKRGRVWWMSFMYDGRQVRRSTEVTDKDLALRIYHKVLGQIAEGKWFERLPGDEKSVRELLERYLAEYSAPNKACNTHRRDKSLMAHLTQALGSVTLTRLRPAMIAEYKGQRRAEKAAPKTINDELTLLSHAYKLAMQEWEWVTSNPVQRVSREKVRNHIERWLSADEEKRLLAASPIWLKEIILFAIHTGLRQGEILNLQWPQVDLFRRTIILLEQKNRNKDTLPVNATALEVLKARARVRASETDYVESARRDEWAPASLLSGNEGGEGRAVPLP
jgi:integrase